MIPVAQLLIFCDWVVLLFSCKNKVQVLLLLFDLFHISHIHGAKRKSRLPNDRKTNYVEISTKIYVLRFAGSKKSNNVCLSVCLFIVVDVGPKLAYKLNRFLSNLHKDNK